MKQNDDFHIKSISSPVYIPSNNNTSGILGPSTPGPQPIGTIQNYARDRFAGIVWMQKTPLYSLDDYFLEYDHWELYSETKSYSKRTYQAAYKGIMRDYNNYLCVLDSEHGEEYYVVAKRLRNELESLEPYCPCSLCICSWLNPLKYIWCPHCTKCIKAGIGFAHPDYITKARKLKTQNEQTKQKPVPKYRKYFQNIPLIKITEAAVVGTVAISSLYFYF